MNFGLKEATITAIQNIFAEHLKIQKAILYGSRAKGNFRDGSDIDLSLVGDDLDLTELLKIENELDDLLLPYKIDLSLFHRIENQDLIDHINRIGIVFFKRS